MGRPNGGLKQRSCQVGSIWEGFSEEVRGGFGVQIVLCSCHLLTILGASMKITCLTSKQMQRCFYSPVSIISFYSVVLMTGCLGVLLPLEGLPLSGIANSWRKQTTRPGACLSYVNQPPQSPHPNHLRWGSHSRGHSPLALITPRPGIRQPETAPVPKSLLGLKLSRRANPKSAYPASPVPSHSSNNKGSCPCSPPSAS